MSYRFDEFHRLTYSPHNLVLMAFTVETEQETDGRWIAEIPQIPGALAYGSTRDEAIARVEALGLRVRRTAHH
jgi:hypothetical protein